MSPLDPEVPPVGEEIHLPGPTLIPFLNGDFLFSLCCRHGPFLDLRIPLSRKLGRLSLRSREYGAR